MEYADISEVSPEQMKRNNYCKKKNINISTFNKDI